MSRHKIITFSEAVGKAFGAWSIFIDIYDLRRLCLRDGIFSTYAVIAIRDKGDENSIRICTLDVYYLDLTDGELSYNFDAHSLTTGKIPRFRNSFGNPLVLSYSPEEERIPFLVEGLLTLRNSNIKRYYPIRSDVLFNSNFLRFQTILEYEEKQRSNPAGSQ